jgi:sugar lactone lactonase YvrE
MKRATWFVLFAAGMFALTASAQPSLQTLVTNGLAEPYGVAVDADNVFYVTDSANNRVAKYNPNSGLLINLSGVIGESGRNDGLGVFAHFFNPQGIVAARGGMVVADSGNHLIRFVAPSGTASTLAGSSAGFADATGTAAQFNFPSGLAADAAGNIYVADMLNNRVRRIDLNNAVTTVASGFSRPTAVALNRLTGELYVTDTGTHSIRVVQPDGTVSLFAGSGSAFISGNRNSVVATNALFNSPRGLLWAGGNLGLVVSDTGNKLIRRIFFNTNNALNTFSVETFVGSGGVALQSPIGLALDKDGNIPLVDLGANSLLSVQVTVPQPPVSDPSIGVVILTTNAFGQLRTSLVPVVNSTFNNDVTVAILAERGTDSFYTLDPNANFPEDPSSRLTPPPYQNGLVDWPFSSSLIRPSRDGSNLTVRAVSTQSGRKPSQIVAARFQFNVAGTIINGKDPGAFTLDNATEGAEIWYTVDGSSPTNAAPSRQYTLGTTLDIVNGTNDVVFKVRGFKLGYAPSTEITKTFLFSDLQTTRIGITRDFTAGVGSTIVIPIEVKLAPDRALRSLQFRVEVTPTPLTPGSLISSQFRSLTITTNDFIRLALPSTNPPLASVYTTTTNTGLAVSFVGTTSGLDLRNSATVVVLAVPIPTTAANNQKYDIQVVQPSGTSDGLQTPVRITTFDKRTITVTTNVSYVVGDSAIASWYNAGDFGNTNINNNDVNNAFHASLGLFTPYPFTDVFDAMDAFPEDSLTSAGGDGQIRFLDWQIILQRSLRLSTINWTRSWSANGVRIARGAALGGSANSPAETLADTGNRSGAVRQAVLRAEPLENTVPGSVVQVPVSIVVASGHQVKGLQFRALIVPEGGAPALDQPVQFTSDSSLPNPISLQGLQEGMPLNQAASAWSLIQNPFTTPLQNLRLLGQLRFTIPASAQPGQNYTVRFANADGSPDLQTQYNFDSTPAAIWVGQPAPTKLETISDEWKLRYFGNLANPWAKGDADPDGDGVPNALEFAIGQSPIKLRFQNVNNDWRNLSSPQGFKLRWYGETGKSYRVESSRDLLNWSSVAERSGQNEVEEVLDNNAGNSTQFYRLQVKPSAGNGQ